MISTATCEYELYYRYSTMLFPRCKMPLGIVCHSLGGPGAIETAKMQD